MSHEADEKVLLKDSFERLQFDFDRFSTFFYEALFRRAPELEKMFRDDLTGQGMKFMTTLRELVLHAQDAASEAERVTKLGSFHASLGVHAESFGPMEEALIDTLKHTLGDDVTPELEAAWRNAYADISSRMIRDGGIS